MSIHDAAYAVLAAGDIEEKLQRSREAVAKWRSGALLPSLQGEVVTITEPGMPEKLKLVPPRELPRRSAATQQGRVRLIHALVHIEFVAINLAWDVVYRFRDMPHSFYDDWVQIANEEASHFAMLNTHLRSLGSDYGDLPAHNGLWEMALKTEHDIMVRMALVPRCLEARGLDVNPAIKAGLVAHGDDRAGEILDIILRDEIGHVAVGDHWFRHQCLLRGIEPERCYRELVSEYMKGNLRGPFSLDVRRQAGFSEAELYWLEGMDGAKNATRPAL